MNASILSSEAIQSALSACLFENPYRLMSLRDVLEFYAERIVNCEHLLSGLQAFFRNGPDIPPDESTLKQIADNLVALRDEADRLGLDVTFQSANKVLDHIITGNYTGSVSQYRSSFSSSLDVLLSVFPLELKRKYCFMLSNEEARLYESNLEDWGKAPGRFADSINDMVEAEKCLSLNRYTACVFHLMRVTEHVLFSVGRLIGVKALQPGAFHGDANWAIVLRAIDQEVQAPYEKRIHKGMADLLSNISSQMHAVNKAWRVNTMHISDTYGPEQCKKIFHSTLGLVAYVAEHLPSLTP